MMGLSGVASRRFRIPDLPPALRRFAVAGRLLLALLLSLWCPGLGQIHGRAPWRGLFTFLYVTLSFLYIGMLTLLLPPVGQLIVTFQMAMSGITAIVWLIALADSLYLALKRSSRQPTRYERWWVLPAFLVFMPFYLLGIGQAVKTYGPSDWQRIRIVTESMEPSLTPGDVAVSWKDYYADHDPEPGDIVALKVSGGSNGDVLALRRIVALAGDRVQMVDGTLTVNDVPVGRDVQKQKKAGTKSAILETLSNGHSYKVQEDGKPAAGGTTPAFIVPRNSVFVLKDNRYAAPEEERKVPAIIPVKSLGGKVTAVAVSHNFAQLFNHLD